MREVDFGKKSPSRLTVSVASALRGGTINVYSGGTDRQLIASVKVPPTGGWEEWESVTVPLATPVTGVHDLTFAFSGQKGCKLFNFDFWKFD